MRQDVVSPLKHYLSQLLPFPSRSTLSVKEGVGTHLSSPQVLAPSSAGVCKVQQPDQGGMSVWHASVCHPHVNPQPQGHPSPQRE